MAATTFPVHMISFQENGDLANNCRPASELEVPLVVAESTLEKENSFSNQPSQNPVLMTMTLQPYSPSLSQSHKNRSRSSSSGPVCRICHEGDCFESLISPCECLGSLSTVHRSCLEKWLSSSNSTHCEICKYRYSAIRCPRPLWHWFRSHGLRDQSHGFYGDLVCLLILAPLCLVSVYLCGVGASVYMKYGVWEGTGLALLCCFLLGTFLLWCAVTVRFHWKMISDWRRSHQVVRLVLESNQSCLSDVTAEENKINNNVEDPVDSHEVMQVPVVEIQ